MAKLQNEFYAAKRIAVPNFIFHDDRLDVETLGFLCIIAALPEGYELNEKTICELSSDPEDVSLNCFRKLKELGYLVEQNDKIVVHMEADNV